MSVHDVIAALDNSLPDTYAIAELSNLLIEHKIDGSIRVELNEEWKTIPPNAKISVIAKAFFKEYYDVGFPTGYRVQLAIGDVGLGPSGLTAQYCFATLFFNELGRRITVDFHTNLR